MEALEILLGQRETFNARELEARLEDLGYLVTAIVSSGLEALELAERLQPDLALIDMSIEGELNAVETASMLGVCATGTDDDVPP